MYNKTIAELISNYIVNFKVDDVPKDVIDHSKNILIDVFGVSISFMMSDDAINLRNEFLNSQDNHEIIKTSLWGTSLKADTNFSIIYNSFLIHGMDFDDTHVKSIVHPSASVVSSAITYGEKKGSTGKEVLEAIICGWEIITRLGLAAEGKFHDFGFHATSILSSFASVCVISKLNNYSENIIVNALGICGSQSAGLQEFLTFGDNIKKLHSGWGNHSALYAIKFAKAGITGPRSVFEGKYGLYKSHLNEDIDILEYFDNLGVDWETKNITIKKYPCCHFTHSFIDLILEFKAEHNFSNKEIKSIECRIPNRFYNVVCIPSEEKKEPNSDYGMRFSLPYLISVAYINGELGINEIDLINMENKNVTDLINKVKCISDEELSNPGHFPGWICIELNNGKKFKKVQMFENGSKENPLNKTDFINKFYTNTKNVIDKKQQNKIIKLINKFSELDKIDILLNELNINKLEE